MAALGSLYTTISSFFVTIWSAVVGFFAYGFAHMISINYLCVLVVACVVGAVAGKVVGNVLWYVVHRKN